MYVRTTGHPVPPVATATRRAAAEGGRPGPNTPKKEPTTEKRRPSGAAHSRERRPARAAQTGSEPPESQREYAQRETHTREKRI